MKAPDVKYMSRPWALHPYQDVQQNPIAFWDPDGQDIYWVIRTNDREIGRRAASTRVQNIWASPDLDPRDDAVFLLYVTDLGKLEGTVESILAGLPSRWGGTVEVSVFGHSGLKDGPVGDQTTTGPHGRDKQMAAAGYATIDVRWAPNATAFFCGCRTAQWVVEPKCSVRGRSQMGPPARAVLIPAVACVSAVYFLAACGDDPYREPREARMYRGGPSVDFCGARWSLDHESVSCDAASMSLDSLHVFTSLKDVRVSGGRVWGPFLELPTVKTLILDGASPVRSLSLTRMPNLESVMLVDARLDFAVLPRLQKLNHLMLVDVEPPSVTQLAAVSGLRRVDLTRIRCERPSCALELGRGLQRVRPLVEVYVEGRALLP